MKIKISKSQWEAIGRNSGWIRTAQLLPSKLWFYHGSSTGKNNEVIQSFLSNGVQPDKAQGYGQGAGFYVWMSKDDGYEHAINYNKSGFPMIIKFQENLVPENFDFDYEVNLGMSGRILVYLWDQFKKIPDGQIKGKYRPSTPSKGFLSAYEDFYIIPSKCTIDQISDVHSKDPKNNKVPKINIVYKDQDNKEGIVNIKTNSKSTGNATDAPIYASIINYFETNSSLVHEFEQQRFNNIIKNIQSFGEQNYCLKYDGKPFSINAGSNIEVMYDNKWIDGQTFLSLSQKQDKQQNSENQQPQQNQQPTQNQQSPQQQTNTQNPETQQSQVPKVGFITNYIGKLS